MPKKIIFAVIISVLVITGTVLFNARTINAQSADDSNSAILSKLDEIIANQNKFAQELASMKEELNIIKIRITQQQ